MKRFSMSLLLAGAILACASSVYAASPNKPADPRLPYPPPATAPEPNPAPVGAPACALEPRPDVNCVSGFRTYLVCYVKNKVVSQTVKLCAPTEVLSPSEPQ